MVNGGADIQPDRNWTKVHNSILELLAQTPFTARELRCLLFLLRSTYGYQCKESGLSLSEWEQGTNMKRSHIVVTLKELAARKVIVRLETGPRSKPIWSFNKYFEQWESSTHVGTGNSTPIGTIGSTHVGTKGSTPFQCTTTPIKESKESTKELKVAAEAVPAAPTVSYVEQFHAFTDRLKDPKANRSAILREIYVWCFGAENAPDYAYLGKVARQVNGAGRLAQLMVELVARPPAGDILAYIVAAENGRKTHAKLNGRGNEIKELLFSNGEGND